MRGMAQILGDIFNQDVFRRLQKVVENPINQEEKIDKLTKILDTYNLKVFDSGTNRVIFRHKKYPDVVFKVAMDEQGVLDNLNEYEKSDKSSRFPDGYDIDYDGYVLVQRRDKRIDQGVYETDDVQSGIRKMLSSLSKDFVLIDLGMDKRKNFGVDNSGRYTVLDFGYLTYKSLANFNCPMDGCKGTLEYTKNFSMMKCSKCGNKFKPDVVLEGHGEHIYAIPPKSQKFTPSKELEEFYKNFKNSRDMSTLKEYVSLNNTQNASNGKVGEEKMATTKENFLSKVKAFSKPDNVAKPKMQTDRESQKRVQLNNTAQQHAAHTNLGNGIDAIHRNGTDSQEFGSGSIIHSEDLSNDRDMAVNIKRLITKQLPDGVPGDEIISEIFYARFPDLRVIIESVDVKQMASGKEQEGLIQSYHDFIEVEKLDRDCIITVDCDSNAANGKDILLNVQYRGITFRIDIGKHIPLLYEAAQNDINMDAQLPSAIVTYMYALDKNNFNGDYESQYFDTDSSLDNTSDGE